MERYSLPHLCRGHARICQSDDTAHLINQEQIILGGNTYHMLCDPVDIIQAAGGMHKFISWSGPMLTKQRWFPSV